jgi:hypothetical protein
MPACNEVSRAIATDELVAAGWRRKLSIKLHLLMCRHCRRYARQLKVIGTATQRMFGQDSLEPGSRARLRSSILKRIPPPDSEPPDSDV